MIVAEFRQLLTGLPWTLALMSATFVVGALLGLPLMLARRSRFLPLRLLVVVIFAIFVMFVVIPSARRTCLDS